MSEGSGCQETREGATPRTDITKNVFFVEVWLLIVIQNNVILTLRFSSCSGTSMALLMSVCGHGVYGGLGRGASQWWTPCPSNAAQDGIGKLLLYILKHESECSKRLDVFLIRTLHRLSFMDRAGGFSRLACVPVLSLGSLICCGGSWVGVGGTWMSFINRQKSYV